MNTQDKTKQTQRLTLPLHNLGCSSGDALTVERILAQQSGGDRSLCQSGHRGSLHCLRPGADE